MFSVTSGEMLDLSEDIVTGRLWSSPGQDVTIRNILQGQEVRKTDDGGAERYGSVVKITCCSCRGPTWSDSQLHAASEAGDLIASVAPLAFPAR